MAKASGIRKTGLLAGQTPRQFSKLTESLPINMYPLESPDFADNIYPSPSDFAETVVQRKEAARKTLRPTSNEELHALSRELFPDGTHPWAATFSQFIEEHKAEPALRGETFERIAFVYYPRSNRGIWYRKIGDAYAVGLLDENELKILSEVATEAGRF